MPKNVTITRRFFSFTSYYRRFVKGFSKISRALTSLTKKDSKFVWLKECKKTFQLLKEKEKLIQL